VLRQWVEGIIFVFVITDISITAYERYQSMTGNVKEMERTPCQLVAKLVSQIENKNKNNNAPRNRILLSDQNGMTTPAD
jgi:hypothetical protein